MLELMVEGELYNESENEFITIEPRAIRFEHSLLSLSKWESIWKKPFLDDKPKSLNESRSYLSCMSLDDISDSELDLIMANHFSKINSYIETPQTATRIRQTPGGRRSSSVTTSELIYYWMFSAGIPADPCETWHLSRLLTLIEIFGIKNSPKKKMSKSEISRMYQNLNSKRRAKMGTSG